MTDQKQFEMVKLIIDLTKDDKLAWERAPAISREAFFAEQSFQATWNNKIRFELENDGDTISCRAHNLSLNSYTDLHLDIREEEKMQEQLQRLYNLVYSKFPNSDDLFEEFINSP